MQIYVQWYVHVTVVICMRMLEMIKASCSHVCA